MKLSKLQIIIFVLLVLTPLFFSMLPFVVQSVQTPPDRVFMGLHRWSEDYFGYLHTINQGIMENILNVSKLTNIPHQPALVHAEYALLGLIGGVFSLNSVLVYHLSRLFLGFIFLLTSFYFFYLLFKSANRQSPIANSVLAFFLAFFVGGFPKIISLSPFVFAPYLSWLVELDVTRRSTILPHYLMGNILFLVILICIIKLKHNNPINNDQSPISNGQSPMTNDQFFNSKFLILLFFSSFFLSLVHPIDFLVLLCTLGLYFLFHLYYLIYSSSENLLNTRRARSFQNIVLIRPSRIRTIKKYFCSLILNSKFLILIILLIFLSGLPPILYYKYTFTLPFWRFIGAHGATTPYSIPLFDFVMSQGPVFFLAIAGLVCSIWYLVDSNRTTGGWRTKGLPTERLQSERSEDEAVGWGNRASGPAFAKSVLASAGKPVLLLLSWLITQSLFFLKLYELFNFDRLRALHPPYYLALAFFAALFINQIKTGIKWREVIIFVLIITTIPLSLQSLKNQIYEVSDFKYFPLFSYPTLKQYQSYEFLKKNTPDDSLITSMYEASFQIPAVSGNKIAFGANFENDPGFAKNKEMITKLYQGTADEKEAEIFLKKNNISYLYWGYQEKSYGGDLTSYQFLSKIFDNGDSAVFKVK